MPTDIAIAEEQLRTFHLKGDAPRPSDAGLQPATLPETAALESFFPICVHPDGGSRPLAELVAGLEHAKTIVYAFRMAMAGSASMLAIDAAKGAIDSLAECPAAEIAQLRKLLPRGTFLVAYHPNSLVLLHAAALAESRREGRTRFWDEVRRTASRLREILLLDKSHAPGAISAESVNASLGSRAGSFFNSGMLAKALQRPANPNECMEPARRSRCQQTLITLEEALHDAANDPAFFLYHSDTAGRTDVVLWRGAECWSADSFEAAFEACGVRLNRLAEVLRAVRVARLEIASAYEPELHDDIVARFDWQSASADELLAIPPIVVVETAARLAQSSLTSFGRLLRSGRPIQILITRGGLEPADLSGFSPDLGFLAIAHRESFVLQSSMARLEHLVVGLGAMAKSQRPAVGVIAVPDAHGDEGASWLAGTLLVESRAVELYSYDPDAGVKWSERFRFEMGAKGATTPAHAAATMAGLQHHFRLIAASEWSSEQMEMEEYLAAYQTRPPLAIPFIWVTGPGGVQARALVTRDVANYCVDRRRAWDLFAELAGVGKAKEVPNEKAREEGAHEALRQVIAMLGVSR